MTINLKIFQHFSEMLVFSTFFVNILHKVITFFRNIRHHFSYIFVHLLTISARQPPARRPARGEPPRPAGDSATTVGRRRPAAPSSTRSVQAAGITDMREHATRSWRTTEQVVAEHGRRPWWRRTKHVRWRRAHPCTAAEWRQRVGGGSGREKGWDLGSARGIQGLQLIIRI
jgi:hypothetical protein